MASPWRSSGPTVYDEHGEWIADCRVPSVYSQTQVEAIAKQIADDHNEVERLRALLSAAHDTMESLVYEIRDAYAGLDPDTMLDSFERIRSELGKEPFNP